MIEIHDKADCCGCTACINSCPVDAISMVADNEGFLYPKINLNSCIGCNKCNNVCPIKNNIKNSELKRRAYVCQNRNPDIRSDSTSGGVFSALASYVLQKGGYVFGAEFDQYWKVKHSFTNKYEELWKLRGSKYVQSDLDDSFVYIQSLLQNGKWVLFSGTPCQVQGLYSFLNKDYDNLLLMDIVCYAISSPLVWDSYLNHLVTKHLLDLTKVRRIKFRDKNPYGYEYSVMAFWGDDGERLYSSGPESNQMLRSFVSNTSTRPSCYKCKFKGLERISDFTVWDCYNIYQYDKKLDDNKGTSHLITHTPKAEMVLRELERSLLIAKPVDIIKAVASEPAMTECASPNKNRAAFFDAVNNKSDAFDLYFPNNNKTRLENILRRSLSKIGIYKYVKRFIKSLRGETRWKNIR